MCIEQLERLAAAALAVDGSPPFSDQTLTEARRGERLIETGDDWVLVRTGGDVPEVEFVVQPDARGRGIGTELADRLSGEFPHFTAWAHGDHPAARAIAARVGARRERSILQLRRPVPQHPDPVSGVRAFRPEDVDALLETNAAAFADHPEQGSIDRADLDDRFASDWFDPADLLVVDGADGGLDAFIWCKIVGEIGELYVVGVHPRAQGRGLGKLITRAALTHIAERGATHAHLYVDGEDERAVGLYRDFGFVDYAIDVLFAR